MKIYYKLLRTDEKEHSIFVRYYTDKLTEEFLSIERNEDGSAKRDENGNVERCRTDYYFNVFEIPSPSKERFIEIIQRNAPVSWLHLQEQILNANTDTDMSSIQDIINQPISFEFDTSVFNKK